MVLDLQLLVDPDCCSGGEWKAQHWHAAAHWHHAMTGTAVQTHRIAHALWILADEAHGGWVFRILPQVVLLHVDLLVVS
jgi:hypothetical protein